MRQQHRDVRVRRFGKMENRFVAVRGVPAGAKWSIVDQQLTLHLAPAPQARRVQLLISAVMAPAGGVNKTIPTTGKQATFKFQLPYGTAPGTYRVRARAATNTNTPTVETTFSYGWAM